MPVFTYQARDLTRRIVAGSVTAESAAAGRQRLRAQGLALVRFESAVEARSNRPRIVLGGRQREQTAELFRSLALLLRAGLPLTEALEVLTRRRKGALVAVIKDVADRILGGASAAEALAAHPAWFDALMISAVRVGELTGHLDETVQELAEHLQQDEKLRGQVTGALAYPMVVVAVGTGVVLFLMTYVLPQLLQVLEASGRPLPTSTWIVQSISVLLREHWFALSIAVVAGAVGLTAALRHEKGQRLWHAWQLRLPLVGPLLRKTLVARLAQPLTLLLRTGVPFVEALREVAAITKHRVLRGELEAAAHAVEAGRGIALALTDSRVLPPVVVQVLAVGQESGELPTLLAELRTRYDTEVRLAVQRFTAVLEPLLIVLLAVAVGVVVFACLMPILEATKGIA